MGWLKAYIRQYRWQFISGSGGKFLEALFEILVPTFVAAMVDEGVRRQEGGLILRYGALILTLSLIGSALAIYAQFQAAKASQGIGTAIRQRIWHVIQGHMPEQRAAFERDEIMTSITSDSEQVQLGIAMAIRLLLRAPFIVLGATVLAGFLAPHFLWLFLLITLTMTLLLWLTLRLLLPLYRKNQRILGRIAQQVADIGAGLRFVRGFRAFRRESDEAESLYQAGLRLADRISFLQVLLSPLSLLILNGSIIGLLYWGGIDIHRGGMTSGTLIALVNYMYQISAAVLVVSNVAGILSRAAAAAARLSVYYREEAADTIRPSLTAKIAQTVNTAKTGDKRHSILFLDQVGYTYPGASLPALEQLSFSLEKDDRSLGIIGQTGCGKSTLAQLLAGLRRYSGTAEFDGEQIVDRRQMTGKIGYVSQKAAILSGSIRTNLLMADDYSDDEVQAALTAADAWEFVSRFPDKMDHGILEDGKNLSGGQRQRLALARALLRKPACLILDDTFSALDYRTMANVRVALACWPGLELIIMISQRVDHVREMDRILLLDGGRMAGFGDHQSLVQTSALYREICTSQDVPITLQQETVRESKEVGYE
ncbi:MAG: ABC transporter ATP-binding protein [Eubacteriales bacterium]|nr:ABC transporter ATP-binding protein [Eubacteriales bacterium]